MVAVKLPARSQSMSISASTNPMLAHNALLKSLRQNELLGAFIYPSVGPNARSRPNPRAALSWKSYAPRASAITRRPRASPQVRNSLLALPEISDIGSLLTAKPPEPEAAETNAFFAPY